MAEMDIIKTFLSNETPPTSTSKIKKISYYDDQDMDEYLAEFEKEKGYVKK